MENKLKISYYLKSGSFSLYPVIALLSFGYSEFDVKSKKKVYKPVRYYTPLKVDPDEWDYGNSKPLLKNQLQELSLFEKQAEDCYRQMQLNGEQITPDSFKNALDVKFGKKKEVDKMRIRMTDYIDDYILTSNEFKDSTKLYYETVKRKIEELEKKIGKPIYANEVDEDLYKIFEEFIRSKVSRHNSVWSNMKAFKAILNKIAKTFKIPMFNPAKELDNKDKIKSRVEDKVYLNFNQIQKLMRYKPKTAKLRNTKLIFLTLLFSGCRFSDVFKVKPEGHYNEQKESFYYAHFITQKGQKEVIIPILAPLMAAIKENGNKTAYPVPLWEFDQEIKELIRLCGIENDHSLTYMDSNGVKRFEKKPFYQFVSSHTGRRSFITNLINYVPITMLCKLTTHELKDNSIIFIYNKISLLDNALLFIRQLARVRIDYKSAFPFALV